MLLGGGIAGLIGLSPLDQPDRHQSESTLAVTLVDGHLTDQRGALRGRACSCLADRRRDERPKDRQRRDRIARQPHVARLGDPTD
jgi:hypothetical protein